MTIYFDCETMDKFGRPILSYTERDETIKTMELPELKRKTVSNEQIILNNMTALILRGWTQKAHARDKDGKWVNALSDSACRWCINGALVAAAQTVKVGGAAMTVFNTLEDLCGEDIGVFNDSFGTGVEDILGLIERAKGALS